MIPTRIHGVLDYLIGAVLIAAPWIFGFANAGPETWVPVLVGAGLIIYSLFTNYELGLVGLISVRGHLRIDIIAGLFLAASPWIFGFADVVWAPHLIVGLIAIGIGMMTQIAPRAATANHHGTPSVGRR